MAGADVPDDDGVVGAGAEEDVLGRRVPFDVGDAPLVALEVHQPLAWPTQTEKTKKKHQQFHSALARCLFQTELGLTVLLGFVGFSLDWIRFERISVGHRWLLPDFFWVYWVLLVEILFVERLSWVLMGSTSYL